MARHGAIVSVVVALAWAVGVVAPATAQAQATENVFSYVLPGWVDYSANSKPYEGFYANALRGGCPSADQVASALGAAEDVGLNATVGDRTGRIVGRVRTQDLGSKQSKVIAALRQPGCLALAADPVLSGTLSQYPTRPAAPTFAATTTDVGGATRLDFNGPSASGVFGGAILFATAGDVVNLMSVRVANPQPGELDTIVNGIAPTVRYGAEVAAVAGPSAKLFTTLGTWGSAADVAFVESLKSSFADAAAQPAPRGTAPVYPAGCDDAFDGFVYSGQKSALGGTAVSGGGGQAQILLTPQVFATAKDARRYTSYFDDATSCVQNVFGANAGGQAVQPVTRTPASGLSKKEGECAVSYSANLGSPTAATRVFAVHLVPGAPRAVSVSAQFAGTPAAQTAAQSLCSMLAAAYKK